MAKYWMAEAFGKHPGKFTRAAKARGVSTEALANKVTKPGSRASTTLKREGALAKRAQSGDIHAMHAKAKARGQRRAAQAIRGKAA